MLRCIQINKIISVIVKCSLPELSVHTSRLNTKQTHSTWKLYWYKINKSLLSLLRRLSTWRCPHSLMSTGAPAARRPQRARSYRSISSAHRTLSSKPAGRRCCCWSTGQTDGRTDRQTDTPDRYIYPAPHTTRAASINLLSGWHR